MTTELDYLLGITEQPDYDLEIFVSRAKYFIEESSRNFLSARGMLILFEIVSTQEVCLQPALSLIYLFFFLRSNTSISYTSAHSPTQSPGCTSPIVCIFQSRKGISWTAKWNSWAMEFSFQINNPLFLHRNTGCSGSSHATRGASQQEDKKAEASVNTAKPGLQAIFCMSWTFVSGLCNYY